MTETTQTTQTPKTTRDTKEPLHGEITLHYITHIKIVPKSCTTPNLGKITYVEIRLVDETGKSFTVTAHTSGDALPITIERQS